MPFLSGGQLSTENLVLQFVYIFIISFPVRAGIKINSSPNRKCNYKCTQIVRLICQFMADLQRGRTYNSKLIRSCMSFLPRGQLSTDKIVLQSMYIFTVSAGIKINSNQHRNVDKINSSQNRKWNYENVHKL